MNQKLILITVPLFLLLLSCNSDKKALLKEYIDLQTLIENQKMDEIMVKLDTRSMAYVEFVTDTANLLFPVMKDYGKSVNLPLFTTVYNHQFGDIVRQLNGDKTAFLKYLGINDVSIFGWFTKLELREAKTNVSKGSHNYVVVAKKVNNNTYITSKVIFIKDAEGIYRLDLLRLLELREKILRQSYNHYVKTFGTTKVQGRKKTYEYTGEEIPNDWILSFVENMATTEHKLEELRYDSRIKEH